MEGVEDRLRSRIVGLNTIRGMDVFVRLLSSWGLSTGWPPVQMSKNYSDRYSVDGQRGFAIRIYNERTILKQNE
jgi:hypothetical protein